MCVRGWGIKEVKIRAISRHWAWFTLRLGCFTHDPKALAPILHQTRHALRLFSRHSTPGVSFSRRWISLVLFIIRIKALEPVDPNIQALRKKTPLGDNTQVLYGGFLRSDFSDFFLFFLKFFLKFFLFFCLPFLIFHKLLCLFIVLFYCVFILAFFYYFFIV